MIDPKKLIGFINNQSSIDKNQKDRLSVLVEKANEKQKGKIYHATKEISKNMKKAKQKDLQNIKQRAMQAREEARNIMKEGYKNIETKKTKNKMAELREQFS